MITMQAVQNATMYLLLATATIWIMWDIIAAQSSQLPTITEVVRRAPKWITFALGFIAGHLFWGS